MVGTQGSLNYKGFPAGSASDNTLVWTQVEFRFSFIITAWLFCQKLRFIFWFSVSVFIGLWKKTIEMTIPQFAIYWNIEIACTRLFLFLSSLVLGCKDYWIKMTLVLVKATLLLCQLWPRDVIAAFLESKMLLQSNWEKKSDPYEHMLMWCPHQKLYY